MASAKNNKSLRIPPHLLLDKAKAIATMDVYRTYIQCSTKRSSAVKCYNQSMETAVFAGGCFWCTEAIFEKLQGVSSVESGYTGGNKANPDYHQVSGGNTGHAEAIQITFDPKEISFSDLVEVFFATHDSTTLNQQGADVGTQYRSAIFYIDEKQKEIAQKAKDQISGSVTEIVPFQQFFKAEDYHQDYFTNNQNAPYCQLVINPKLKKLQEKFGRLMV